MILSLFLNAGKAVGETIIVAMVAGNIPQMPTLFGNASTLPWRQAALLPGGRPRGSGAVCHCTGAVFCYQHLSTCAPGGNKMGAGEMS